jgi:hypothetical protein
VLAAIVLALQSVSPLPRPALVPPDAVHALRIGLDTLYGGDFERAAAYFAALAARTPADPAPVVFQAGAYIWWATARDSADFALQRIDSLLGVALTRARAAPGMPGDFWLATALGYRARQREEHGHGYSAAKDAKAMRDIYRRLLAADSSCADCYLGLGVYDYGLARAGAFARFFARIIGLGSGNAERGIRYMRHAAHDGDLARVESTWVLAVALMREAARDPAGRAVLQSEARGYVEGLAARYPDNPVFQRFLREAAPLTKTSAAEPVGAPARAATAAVSLPPPIGRRQRGEFAEHVVHVTLHGVRRDVEPLRDLFVAESGRNQIFDLLLPLRETHVAGRRHAGADAADDVRTGGARGGGRWRQIGAARDGANRFHYVLCGRVLHDEAVDAAVDELIDVLLGRNKVHDDRFRVGGRRLQVGEELIAIAVREGGIEQHHLRLRLAQRLHGGSRALRAGDDVDVGERGEQSRETVAHHPVVFDDEHANTRGRRGRARATFRATTVQRTFAIRSPIIQSASTLGRDPTLDTANGPRHNPPPILDVMYWRPGTSGIHRGDETAHGRSPL